MPSDPRISELLLRWRELRAQGQLPTAADLCDGSPDLVHDLRRSIRAVEAMEQWLGLAGAVTPAHGTVVPPTCSEADGNGAAPVTLPADVPGYEVLSVLDQGGMGIVYKARQLRLKRLVALKMMRSDLHLKPHQLARFRVEAEAVAQLQHPNIVQIYEVGECAGRPFFSMELVEGGSLAARLSTANCRDTTVDDRMPRVDFRWAAELIATLARAIHFAHERGVIHRDLKPANILMVSGGGVSGEWSTTTHHSPLTTHQAKIADFGLAKLVNSDSQVTAPGHPTQSGMILGTPSYMAPEQAEGRAKEVGPAVDVYALGAILYELITGRPPFQGITPLDTLLRVVSSAPVPPSQEQPKVPRDLETICLKCLEKAPGHRYASAAALADDLERFLKGMPITARYHSFSRRALKWARRRPEAAALLLVLAAVALGLCVLAALQYREHEEARQAAARLAPRAHEILQRYCYPCHGQDELIIEGDLIVLDYAQLVDPARGLVVPGKVPLSRLIHRIEDGSMPPEEDEEFPRLSSDELEDLKKWVAGDAPPFPEAAAAPVAEPVSPLALEVKDIFREKCHECHRFGNAKNGIKILNHDLLVAKRKVIVPGQPEQSPLWQLLLSKDPKKSMPPPTDEPLTEEEKEVIRRWIAAGAPPFPRIRAVKPAAKR